MPVRKARVLVDTSAVNDAPTPYPPGTGGKQTISPLPPQPYINIMRTITPGQLPYLGKPLSKDIVIVTRGDLTGYTYAGQFNGGDSAGVITWNGMDGDVVAGLGDLDDVTLGTLEFGDTITWDGNSWVNTPAASSTSMTAQINLTLKPVSIPENVFTAWMSSQGGMDTDTADDNYVDVLAMNSYNSPTGGLMNLLAASKTNTTELFHYQGEQGSDSYTTKRLIAYADGQTFTGSNVFEGFTQFTNLDQRPTVAGEGRPNSDDIATMADLAGAGQYPNLDSSGEDLNTTLTYSGTGGFTLVSGILRALASIASVFAVRPTVNDTTTNPSPDSLISFSDLLNQLAEYVTIPELDVILSEYAKLNSPNFTGNPTLATLNLPITDNSTAMTNTNWVVRYVTAALIDYVTKEELDIDLSELWAALNKKANILSPTFQGVPQAPVPVPWDNSAQIATSKNVVGQINILNSTFNQGRGIIVRQGGECLQWFTVQIGPNVDQLTVNLPIPFTQIWSVVAGTQTRASDTLACWINDNASVNVGNGSNLGQLATIWAIGYLDQKNPPISDWVKNDLPQSNGFNALGYMANPDLPNGGVWIACSSDAIGVYYSNNPLSSWTASNLTGKAMNFHGLCIGEDENGIPIAMALALDGSLYYSYNGQTWTAIGNINAPPSGDGNVSQYMQYYNGTWLICGGNNLWRSTNGRTVTPVFNSGNNQPFTAIATDGNGNWACGVGGTQAGQSMWIGYSHDNGLTWTRGQTLFTGSNQDGISNITYGNGIWVAGAYRSQNSNGRVYKSVDNAETWTEQSGVASSCSSINFYNGIFLFTSAIDFYWSTNGDTWNACGLSTNAGAGATQVTYSNGIWISTRWTGGGLNISAMLSKDGKSWALQNTVQANGAYSVATDGNGNWLVGTRQNGVYYNNILG